MFKLPFGSMPGHWGLKGKTREIAKAEYELTGKALELRLLELDRDNFTEVDYNRRLIDIEYKHGNLTEYEYKLALVDLISDPTQKELARVDLDYKFKKTTETEYYKSVATIKKEPWVTVISMDFGSKSALEGSFELDWNEYFVEKLKSEGYQGPTPDNIVNQWFMEVCRNVAMEEFSGTGDFEADSEANLEAFKRWNNSESFKDGRKGYR